MVECQSEKYRVCDGRSGEDDGRNIEGSSGDEEGDQQLCGEAVGEPLSKKLKILQKDRGVNQVLQGGRETCLIL